MPVVQFPSSESISEYSFYDREVCPHCRKAHESIETVREIMRVLARRQHIRGNNLRVLIRAASDLLHEITYPGKDKEECTCNSLN